MFLRQHRSLDRAERGVRCRLSHRGIGVAISHLSHTATAGNAPFEVAIAHGSQLTIDGLQLLARHEHDLHPTWSARDRHEALELLSARRCDILVCSQSLPGGPAQLLDHAAALSRTAAVLVVDVLLDDGLRDRMAGPARAKPALVHGCSPFSSLLAAARAAVSGRAWVDPVLVPELIINRAVLPTNLTARELEVLALVRRGAANKAIALELGIAGGTVKSHIANVMHKLGVTTRTAAANYHEDRARQVDATNQWLADLFHSSNDAIIVNDPNSIITQWNSAASRLYGYSRDEAIGMSALLLSTPAKRDAERALGARVLAGKHLPNAVHHHVTKSGRALQVSITTSPVRDRSGAIVATSAIARDVTALDGASDERRWRMTNHADA